MRIYKDILTGDEMFTDSSKINLVDDCLYEVVCQHVTRKDGDIVLAGSNPSAEEADEGTDDAITSGLDLVLNQRLVETSFNKADYMNYLKGYTKSLADKWKEEGKSDEEIAEAKVKLTEAVKKIRPRLSEVSYYMGESANPDGMVALLDYRDNPDGSGETAYMLFFKHGLEEEKV
ncbi:translationally-controlled tumor protein homolog [Panonychus citri]|uniref:translationally-controlled tumor protein homolog n=1 Tax=Panonychus citri TaxID=50023 RepID=UPI002307EEF9|nr:translationally-controlled tumor protein homolog [Panonychus citri]